MLAFVRLLMHALVSLIRSLSRPSLRPARKSMLPFVHPCIRSFIRSPTHPFASVHPFIQRLEAGWNRLMMMMMIMMVTMLSHYLIAHFPEISPVGTKQATCYKKSASLDGRKQNNTCTAVPARRETVLQSQAVEYHPVSLATK